MADRRISKKSKWQGHEQLCGTGMPVRNGNLDNERTTTTKTASVRKQLGTNNCKSNEGRQAKNGGVNIRDGSEEEPDRETGGEQATVGMTRRKYCGWQTPVESGRVTRWGLKGDEGGQRWYGRTVLREMWRRQDRRKAGRRRQDTEMTLRWVGEEVASSTSPLTKGITGRERTLLNTDTEIGSAGTHVFPVHEQHHQ